MLEILEQAEGIDVFKLLKDTGSIMKGHFKLTSGYHSQYYLQCAKLLQYPSIADKLAKKATEILNDNFDASKIKTVIAPAMGGILWGYMVAFRLGCRMIFTERKENKMELRRNFEIEPGEEIMIAEDVITTGGSVKEIIEICLEKKADIKGIISMVDRVSGVDFGYPYYYMIKINIEKYDPLICRLCNEGHPLVYPGSKKTIK